jgi:uncharacterized membrane protein
MDTRLNILDKKPNLLFTFLLNRILKSTNENGWFALFVGLFVVIILSVEGFTVLASFIALLFIAIYLIVKDKRFKRAESEWLNEINGIK